MDIKLHVHVWEGEDITEEVDVPMTDLYVGMDETDHVQFGGIINGRYCEIRLLTKDILQLQSAIKPE